MGVDPGYGYGRIIDKTNISFYLIKEHSIYNDSSLLLILKHDDGSYSQSNTPENSIILNEWQQVSATYNGESEVKIYINGSEQMLIYNNLPFGSIMDNSGNNLYIGNNSNLDKTFEGIIDEVRIWNIVRNDDQISENYNHYVVGNELGLVGYWQMNEGYGEQIEDITQNSTPAILTITNWIQGKELFLPVNSEDPFLEQTNEFNLSIRPNPAGSIINISYQLNSDQFVDLSITDLIGKKIKTLVESYQTIGEHIITWNALDNKGKNVLPGLYLCVLIVNGNSHLVKIQIAK